MAKRILSADAALVAHAQVSLGNAGNAGSHGNSENSVRTEKNTLLETVQAHWAQSQQLHSGALLFDWEDQRALFEEIAFVNRTQSRLDEVAVKIAPVLLRIVLTVKEHLPSPKEQRAFLLEHLELDFRRISELCIVADSYALLDPDNRQAGEREIVRYGWSKALKLAHVPNARERRDIWEAACNGKPVASYRAVLEEIRRFRERKLIGPPAPASQVQAHLGAARETFSRFSGLAARLNSRQEVQDALKELGAVRRELGRLNRVLQERLDTVEAEALAANT